eukprot:365143-Chlamydomonas_euryale.AAC.8
MALLCKGRQRSGVKKRWGQVFGAGVEAGGRAACIKEGWGWLPALNHARASALCLQRPPP